MVQTANNRFTLALCELHHPTLHGFDDESSPDINGHYLASYTFDADDFYRNEWKAVAALMRISYATREIPPHALVRNYAQVHCAPEYSSLQLVETKELEGGECVAALKTGIIKKIQRSWRRTLAELKVVMEKRKAIKNLKHRETTGRWPSGLEWPQFKIR